VIDVLTEEMHESDRKKRLRETINAAVTACSMRGARLTPIRIRVFELIVEAEKPVKAYELLASLRQERRAAPPTVYRAIDFLMQQGLIHRVAAKSAFVISRRPGDIHPRPFLVCERCGSVTELANELMDQILEGEARSRGFRTTSKTMEVQGVCAACRGLG
jgi:Fur family zinc uptake transcriptional regulator